MSKKIFHFTFRIFLVILISQIEIAFAVPKVAVIGAGLSGLTVAHRLKQAGYPVSIYEARNRPGGRVFTVKINGVPEELGGQNINDGGKAENILQLAKELGLNVNTYKSEVKSVFYDNQKNELIQLYSDPKAIVPPVTEDTILKLKELQSKSPDLASVLDQLFLDKPILRKVFDSRMRSYEGSETQFLSSCYATGSLLWMLQFQSQNAKQIQEGKIPTMETRGIEGGNGQLVLALTKKLAGDIHYGMPLTTIKKGTDHGIKLTFDKNKTIQADVVVLTIPASVLRFMKIEEGLVPGKQWDSIISIPYGPIGKIILPVQVKKDMAGTVLSDRVLTWFNPGTKSITFYYAGAPAIMHSTYSPTFAESLEQDLKAVQAAFPGIGISPYRKILKPLDVQFSSYSGPVAISWPNEEFTRGGYSNISPQLDEKLKQRKEIFGEKVIDMFKPVEGKIFFAGEHTALENPATMEGAVESGERTARMLIRSLKEPVTQ